MTQPDLFSPREHLERVSSRIGAAIVAFCADHVTFHADDLRRHVEREVGAIAPGSVDRILRDLRAKGHVSYRVVNRRASLYEITEAA